MPCRYEETDEERFEHLMERESTMPCYSDQDETCENGMIDEIGKLNRKSELMTEALHKARNELNQYRAAFCALMNEITVDGYTITVDTTIELAEENGKCKIRELWDKHKEEDKDRLKKKLDEYSSDEIKIIRELIEAKEES